MLSRITSSTKWPYLLVTIVWMITRAYPLSQAQPRAYWEVAEAKKLLEYGFSERHGAIINIHFMTGMMPEPWKYNYVNHPYPILWFDTFIYWLGGPWAVLITAALFGLLTCLAVIPALQCRFSQREAGIGALLYTLAPATILFDADTNIVALGAIIWPISIYLIGKNPRRSEVVSAALLGATVFVAGQISWFTYTVFPVLLVATAGPAYNRAGRLIVEPNTKLVIAVIAGGLLTLTVFVLQIWFYTYSFSDTLSYLHGQASAEQGATTPRMYLAIVMRSALSIGPALVLGALAGFFVLIRNRSTNWLQLGSVVYPLCFVAAALALPRFFYRERTMYGYLIFPCTVLTLSALQHLRSKRVTAATLCLAVVSLAYPALQASIPKVSETTKKLGYYIREISPPNEVVATNLQEQQRPFQPWDVGSITNTCLMADRAIRENISSRKSLEGLLKNFKSRELEVVFLYDKSKPIDQSLHAFLERASRPESARFEIPTEPVSTATRLRSLYWRITGKHQSLGEANAPASIEEFEVFRFKLLETNSALDETDQPE
jgi:hypothetical protein